MPKTSPAPKTRSKTPTKRASTKTPTKPKAAAKPQGSTTPRGKTDEASRIDKLWFEYKKTGDTHIREQLLEHYLPLIPRVINRMASRLPQLVDRDDLMQQGFLGLRDALEGFDPTLGIRFSTFASQRIAGAAWDWLRSVDDVPRLVRERAKHYGQAYRAIFHDLGRPPTDDEIQNVLGLDEKEYERLKRDAAVTRKISMQTRVSSGPNDDAEHTLGDTIEDQQTDNPLDIAQRHDIKSLLTSKLSRAERLIVLLYYYEQMTMKEIGVTLDLSESRVSQMHSSILATLKARLHDRQAELEATVG